MLVIVASLMPSALAAGYRTKNGWIITTGDRLFTKTSTVTIKNTTSDELIRVTITGISNCKVIRGPGASWDGGWVGSSFLISPQGSATFYIKQSSAEPDVWIIELPVFGAEMFRIE